MLTSEINIRDPFVLLYDDKYYLYGSRVVEDEQTGFDVYVSDDLENWSEPKQIFALGGNFWGTKNCWAPEVHYYKGRFYMFASFKADGVCRGSSILVSDTPDGTFCVHNARVTPEDMECLDGTLYVENGTPYMVFCHEWVQAKNGEMCAVELGEDLTATVGEPFLLWKAGDAKWVSSVRQQDGHYVTDGPFLFRGKYGDLKSLWSSFSEHKYVLATATAKDGTIRGEWTIDDDFIYDRDGGHGMIFETRDGKKMISLHSPNSYLSERPIFLKMK